MAINLGQIVICLDIGQIVIFLLLTAFSFLRGEFPRRARQNLGQIVKLSYRFKSLPYNIAAIVLYKYTNPLHILKKMTI